MNVLSIFHMHVKDFQKISIPLTHPKFLKRFKCKFENENNVKGSWGTLPSSQHFEGKRGVLKF